MAQAISSPFGAARGASEAVPLSEMNTTPLIDVMLVLLIMFIITVPVKSHQVEMALPKAGQTVEIRSLKNELGLSAEGQLSWNDKAISDAQLSRALGDIAAMEQQPEVHFRPDSAARYERVDQVLAMAARSGADRFGFSGNEQYSQVF